MARRRRPPPPDNTPSPNVTIPESSFPYIMDLIFQAADHDTLLVLRTMNRKCQKRADAILLRHIIIKGPKDPCKPGLDRRWHQFFSVEGGRAPVRPFQAMLSRQDMTSWAQRVNRSSKKEPGLEHVDIVDVVHTFPDLYGFALPALKTVRIHHTKEVRVHWQLRFGIQYLPPLTKQAVIFGHHFPVNIPLKRQHWFSNVPIIEPEVTHDIDSVIVNILPGGFTDPTLHTGNYSGWEKVTNLFVVLSPDFCRREVESALDWLSPWPLFVSELRSLLERVTQDWKATRSVTLVGVADAWFKTTDSMKLGRHLRRVMSPQDVLCTDFWTTIDNRDRMLKNLYDQLSIGNLMRVVKDYKVTVLSLDEYRATRTPAEFEVETAPNASLLAASEAAEIEDFY